MFGHLAKFLGLAVLLSGAVLAQTPFVPDDPYFAPYHGSADPNLPAPGYFGQWHLVNQMPISGTNAGLDVNIAGAWARGLTGAGVIIAIVDEGVEWTHPEFAAKYRNDYSYSFSRTVEENAAPGFIRGLPEWNGLDPDGDNHGTSVAGVAAAQGGNGIGGTGAAPNAQIASLKLTHVTLPPDVESDEAEVASILFQGQTDSFGRVDPYASYAPPPGEFAPVRVVNRSYGINLGFFYIGPEVNEALHTAASWGVINVLAAGNQRFDEENPGANSTADSNKQQLQSSPDVINVAALGSNGKYSYYSSFGANIFVTAPSSSYPGYGISTTDRLTAENGYNGPSFEPDPYFDFSSPGPNDGRDYTSTFGGTSSSAPLVSGIMALGVEANPNLTVRMAQHLLARTSRVVDPTDAVSPTSTGGWVTNGAGYKFNNNYGFGLIDADAFTLAAAHTVGITDLVTHTTGDQTVGDAFSPITLILTENVFVVFADPLPLEYVQVHFSITGLQDNWEEYMGDPGLAGIGAIAGDFEAWLTSPDGTKNRLFIDDRALPMDKWEQTRSWDELSSLDWTFTSYAYWGEDLNGFWTIELINHSTNLTELGAWDSYRMDFGMGDIFIVPEPSVVLLVVSGLGVLVALRRRPLKRNETSSSARTT